MNRYPFPYGALLAGLVSFCMFMAAFSDPTWILFAFMMLFVGVGLWIQNRLVCKVIDKVNPPPPVPVPPKIPIQNIEARLKEINDLYGEEIKREIMKKDTNVKKMRKFSGS